MNWILKKDMDELDWTGVEEVIRRHCSFSDEVEAVRRCAPEILALNATGGMPFFTDEQRVRVFVQEAVKARLMAHSPDEAQRGVDHAVAGLMDLLRPPAGGQET